MEMRKKSRCAPNNTERGIKNRGQKGNKKYENVGWDAVTRQKLDFV